MSISRECWLIGLEIYGEVLINVSRDLLRALLKYGRPNRLNEDRSFNAAHLVQFIWKLVQFFNDYQLMKYCTI